MQVQVKKYPVDVLTAHYRVYGEISTIGDPTMFFNNETVSTLTIQDATLMPIRPNARIGPVSVDTLFVPKTEPHVVILGGHKHEVNLLTNTAQLICFTSTYVVKGVFHMGLETQVKDAFFVGSGPFYPATNLNIHTLYQIGVDVKASAELAYIQRDAIRAFYGQDEAPEG